jgi:hypothetical protein
MIKLDKEDNLEELWCHYSGMPSVLAYDQKETEMPNPKTPPCIGHDKETEMLEDIDIITPSN